MTNELNQATPGPAASTPSQPGEAASAARDKRKNPLTRIPPAPSKRKPETDGEALEPQSSDIQLKPVANRDKLAMWLFLGGEITLFAALILAYTVFRINYPEQYALFRSHLSLPFITLNTLVLLLSSYFVVRALEAAKQDRQRGALIHLLVVLALGALFIGGQAYEWSTLFAAGIGLSNTFGTPFYIVTGIHGSHVLLGLAWLALLLVLGIDRGFDRRHSSGIEIFGLYWHFVDVVWIVLFSLIYLL